MTQQRMGWGLLVGTVGAMAALAQPLAAQASIETVDEWMSGRVDESEQPIHPSTHPPIYPSTPHPATTVDEWMTQIAQTTVQITGVRLETTEAGLQVVLETAAGELSAPTTRSLGNALIAEFPNAVLALPEGDDFFQADPAEGIALVSATNLAGNTVQVAITGVDAAPTAAVSSAAGGLTLSVVPGIASADAEEEAIQVVVTATRRETTLDQIPRSVTVITREQIEAQSAFSRNLEDILTRLVPGASAPAGVALGTFTLRGQGVSILIDGIPQDTNSNATFSAPLAGIDPSIVERIEVIRGPNAIFGGQAIGGLVNIITRRPADQVTATTELGVNSALTNLDGGQGYTLSQQISGATGRVDFTAGLTFDDIGQSYDAEGDRVGNASGFDNTQNLNGLLNLGVSLSDQERLQFRFNYAQSRRSPEFIQDISTDNIPGIQKAQLIRRPEGTQIIGARDGDFLRNTNLTLSYTHDDVLGSQFQGQVYYRNYLYDGATPFDNRTFGGTTVSFQRGETNQLGTRLQVDTPFNSEETLSLLWGLDFSQDRIYQNSVFFDPAELDSSGGLIFRRIDEVPFIPLYTFNDLGLFAQLQWQPSEQWVITGGTRYVNLSSSVDDYQAISLFSTAPPREIEGGSINASGFVFNLGTVYNLDSNLSAFASFGQGFSFPDLGRTLRQPPNAIDSFADSIDINSPVRVDNYELGLRGNWNNLQASLAGFFSYSDSGFDLLFNPDGFLRNVRAPRRVYGIEGTLDWQPAADWALGSTVSWQEGEFDEDNDGTYLAFDSSTIAPLKVTAYVENQTTPGWRNRLQLLYSGNRSRAFNDGIDGAPINAYVTLDFLSTIDTGHGEVIVGVSNILNTLYFPVYAQAIAPFYDPLNFAGSGTSLSLSYRFTW